MIIKITRINITDISITLYNSNAKTFIGSRLEYENQFNINQLIFLDVCQYTEVKGRIISCSSIDYNNPLIYAMMMEKEAIQLRHHTTSLHLTRCNVDSLDDVLEASEWDENNGNRHSKELLECAVNALDKFNTEQVRSILAIHEYYTKSNTQTLISELYSKYSIK